MGLWQVVGGDDVVLFTQRHTVLSNRRIVVDDQNAALHYWASPTSRWNVVQDVYRNP